MSLVAHYPLADWSGNASDLSGNDNHGTVNGATQGVWGVGGLTGFGFDGSDDGVDLPSIPSLQGYTITAWVRPEDAAGNNTILDLKGSNNQLQTQVNSGSLRLQHNDGSNWITLTGGSVSNYQWTHAVFTWNGSAISVYQDGSLQDTDSVSALGTGADNNRIGQYGAGSNNFMDGTIVDVRLYDHALSPSAVEELYEWGSGDYTKRSLHDGTDSGAVSRWFQGTNVTADSWGSNTLTDNTSAGTTGDAVDGQAKSFDGTDDYMSTGYQPDWGTGSFAIGGWVSLDSGSGTNASYIGNFDTNDNRDIILRIDSGTNNYAVRLAGTYYDSGVSGKFNGEWVHIFLTRDPNGNGAHFINGVKVNSFTDSSDLTKSNDIHIGERGDGNDDHINGHIDDVRIYDRALSTAEVAQLYRQHPGGRDMRQELIQA